MLTLFSPAKVNLFFKVLFQREDGYHQIASLFQAVSLGDTLTFELAEDRDQFTSEGIDVPLDSSNLILKALKAFRKKTRLKFFVKIHLVKKIPLGAGLGGGSSNAATTLFGLNQLLSQFYLKNSEKKQELAQDLKNALIKYGSCLFSSDLLALALELGSDVPFFFSSGTAFCQGRGEILEDLQIPLESFYIACPHLNISTKLVFETFAQKQGRNIQAGNIKLDYDSKNSSQIHVAEDKARKFDLKMARALLAWQKNKKNKPLFNDLEDTALFLEPKLARIKNELLSLGFKKVSMTGSGSGFLCFGKPQSKLPKDFLLFPVDMIVRKEGSWYSGEE